MNNFSLYGLCAAQSVLQKAWEMASSKYAIFAYVAIVTIIVVLIILVAMRNESKEP